MAAHHYQGDVRDLLSEQWDLGIFFPDCTYLCGSGLHWTARGLRDPKLTEEALAFVARLLNANITHIALENPVGAITRRLRRVKGRWVVSEYSERPTCPPAQSIQPYQFGHDASKRTCLWLKNLPCLRPTRLVPPRLVDGRPRWGNQTNSGQNKLGPSETRAMERAATYPGIARAMACQWS